MLSTLLRDHRVQGAPVLPGAVALELALAAREITTGRLEEVVFLRPARPDAEGKLELRVELEGSAFQVTDATRGRPFVRGRFAELSRARPTRVDRPKDADETLDAEALYAWFESLGLGYGPWFRGIREARRSAREVWARLEGPRSDAPFVLHPSTFDGALQAIGCMGFGRNEELFLPFSIEAIEIYQPLGPQAEVSARVRDASNDRILADLEIFDASGRVDVRVEGVAIRRVGSMRAKQSAARDDDRAASILHMPVLRALPPAKREPEWSFRLEGDGALKDAVAPALFSGSAPAGGVIYCAGTEPCAIESFVRFARAHVSEDLGPLVVVARHGIPESEAVVAAARSVRLEHPKRLVRAVALSGDIDPISLRRELAEIEPEVVLEGASRFIRALAPVRTGAPFTLPERAPVVVTGGLGGIGMAIAEWLFERFHARLILLGRRDRTNDPQAHRALQALEARGAELMVFKRDVTDANGLARDLEEARARFGALRAVFHGAGQIRDGAVVRKTDADVEAVLAPKVAGVRVLDAVTSNDPLTAFVVLSSLVSYTGNLGQTDYAAANRFLDAYARRRRADGRPTWSIAFGPWADVGMAAPLAAMIRARGIEPLTPSFAISALEQALRTPSAEVVIAEVSETAARAVGVVIERYAEPRDTARTNRSSETANLDAVSANSASASTATREPTTTVDADRTRSRPAASDDASTPAPSEEAVAELERWLIEEVARFLEVEPEHLDPNAKIEDYGVDSILAAQLLRELEKRLGRSLDPVLLFEARTLAKMARRIADETKPAAPVAPAPRAEATPNPARAQAPRTEPTPSSAQAHAPRAEPTPRRADTHAHAPSRDHADASIAIVGFAARLPGGTNLDVLFDDLLARKTFIREVPVERFDIERYFDPEPDRPGKTRSKWGAFLEGVDHFDPLFFGISPREAALMDPQQRLLLEVAHRAIEHSGHGPRLGGTRTGVFVGGSPSEYGQRFFARADAIDGHTATGNSASILANRLSYVFDLKGPSFVVDTACSSALVALHLARESLLRGESEQALVAGVNVLLGPELFIAFSQGRLLSPSGACRPFSHEGDGYVRSEAAAALLLKPLSRALREGDTVHGILLGTAVTQDGRTSGLTTPDVAAQAEAMRRALAGISPADVSYLEAHAVGSPLGDAVELEALERVGLRPRIGSSKGNLGHAEAASGLVSVIKLLLAFQRGVIPPLAGAVAERLSPAAVRDPLPIASGFRALVNAFGFGGTNASAILEPPSRPADIEETPGRQTLLLSAHADAALRALASRLEGTLATRTDLALQDIAFTQNTGRKTGPLRAAISGDRAELRAELARLASSSARPRAKAHPRVALLFTGQGSQYSGMARALFDSSVVFRDALSRCAELVRGELEHPLLSVMFEPELASELDQTLYTQPALFALEWSLCELWRAAGVTPAAVLGHSVGELVAATLAGVMSVEDGLTLICARARHIQALPRGGAMAAIFGAESEVAPLVEPYSAEAAIAAINGPGSVVVSGSMRAVEGIVEAAAVRGLRARRLQVSHAFHSPLVEPMLEAFEQDASTFIYHRPTLDMASNVSGRILGAQDAVDASYWARHVRAPVRFLDGFRALEADVYLEVGPDAILTGLALGAERSRIVVPSLRRGVDASKTLLEASAALFERGVNVDLLALGANGRRVPIPGAALTPRRVWFDAAPPLPQASPAQAKAPVIPVATLEHALIEEVARSLGLETTEVPTDVSLRDLGFDSLMGLELMARLRGRIGTELVIDGLADDASIQDVLAGFAQPRAREARAETTTSTPGIQERDVSSPDDLSFDPLAYARFARPATMERLTAGALDKVYVEARGDRLIALQQGKRIEVLDVLGGFGCTLFGHNHPELVAEARSQLDRQLPVHAQGAHHIHTGRLAAELSRRLEAGHGRQFVSTFVSTGAEAVELALKHAAFEAEASATAFTRKTNKALARLFHDLGDRAISDELARALGLAAGATLTSAIEAVVEHNREVFAERPKAIALERAFHGKTSGAALLTAGRTASSAVLAPGLTIERISLEAPSTLEAAVLAASRTLWSLELGADDVQLATQPRSAVLGLFVEPVQGEGGVRVLPPALIDQARVLADVHGFPIIVDEIQSGFGRTGTFSAAHALGLRGDYYLFGKALGGGLAKIAVLLVDRERYVADFGLAATSTFSEDDPSATLALAALRLYDRDDLEGRAQRIGARLMDGLKAIAARHPSVFREVRGRGLLIGVELADQSRSPSPFLRHTDEEIGNIAASWFLNVANIRFLPMSSATGTIRLEPSAYLSEADQDRILGAFARFGEIMEKGNVARLLGPLAGLPQRLDDVVIDWRHAQGHEPVESEPGDRRVAFITYFTEDDDILDFCPSMAELPRAGRQRLIERLHRVLPPRVVRTARVTSKTGGSVHVQWIGLLATSAILEASMQAGDLDWVRDRLDEAVLLAQANGASVVGFGGLTSIVTHNALHAATRAVALTTGNALTVAMGLEGVRRAATAAGIALSEARVGVVGAAGNIGATYAECLADEVPELWLIGRRSSRARLESLADGLYRAAYARLFTMSDPRAAQGLARRLLELEGVRTLLGERTPIDGRTLRARVDAELGDRAFIRISEDLADLRQANVILAASNAARPIIHPEHIGPGPVVILDVAVPRDVAPEVASRPNVTVIVGGAVVLPGSSELDLVAGHLPRGHVYACMAETMLLGLAGATGHFSFGPIKREKVVEIAALAEMHGFELSLVRDRGQTSAAEGRRDERVAD